MAKDPAFLFYPSDFLTGVLFMTNEEVGMYIKLICAQHQHGHLTLTQVKTLCNGNPTALIFEKLKQDSDGKYYNERTKTEVDKRKQHSEKQRENANMRWHKNGKDLAYPLAMPLEDRNKDVDVSKDLNFLIKIKEETFQKKLSEILKEEYRSALDSCLSGESKGIQEDKLLEALDVKYPSYEFRDRNHLINSINSVGRKMVKDKKEQTTYSNTGKNYNDGLPIKK